MCFAFVQSEIKHFVDYEGVVFNCERLLLSHSSARILGPREEEFSDEP